MKKLHIYTHVFGGHWLAQWRRAGAASLNWPLNLAALNSMDVLWDIYTSTASFEEVKEAAAGLPFQTEVTAIDLEKDASLRPALKKALRAQAYFMPSPPDMIWGDGSVGALLKLMPFAYGRCLAVPHVRVAEKKFMESFTGEPLSNAQLVAKAFAALHESFLGAEVPSQTSNCFNTGVVWTEIGTNLYGAAFFLPTIHMMQPTEEDVSWFMNNKGSGHWDHRWPATLVGSDRQRLIASSDIAFMAELTPDDGVHPVRGHTIKGKWDAYAGHLDHHLANRGTVCVFRGEP